MKTSVSGNRAAILTAAAVLAVFSVHETSAGEAGGRLVLSENSVWRSFMVWRKPLWITEKGTEPARFWGALGIESEMPPGDWAKPDFDDLSWSRWREIRPENEYLKPEKGDGPPVERYDWGQYGFFKSESLGLLCLRGKFTVNDPGKVTGMKLEVEYRGGMVVYVNGKEAGRGHLTKEGAVALDGLADAYPAEAFTRGETSPTAGKHWEDRCYYTNFLAENIIGPLYPAVKRLNNRIRRLEVEVPGSMLRKGTNVVALEIHRSAYPKGRGVAAWGTCGLVTVRLRSSGAVEPNVNRPKGIQVWTANTITRVSPFGGYTTGRIGAGLVVPLHTFPLSWTDPHEGILPVEIRAARNGVFSGQVVVSSDGPIKGLKAEVGDLAATGGGGSIPSSAVRVRFMGFGDKPPGGILHKAVSFIDALYESAPKEVKAREGRIEESKRRGRPSGSTVIDPGAVSPLWISVRVPADAKEGEYRGAMTVSAEGGKPVSVPVMVRVSRWKVPDPEDFLIHMSVAQSPDTVSIYYKVPLWSDEHFKLMETSFSYMKKLGARVIFLPLATRTWWMNNEQSMVHWVEKGEGKYSHDFRVFDRYLDLAQKYLKPDVVCLYAFGGKGASVLNPADGTVKTIGLPDWKTPEAEAFWKPVLDEAMARLEKRGLAGHAVLGLVGDRWPKDKQPIEVLSKVRPDLKWSQFAHYGGQKGAVYDHPYGYVMSVWGVQSWGKFNAKRERAKVPFGGAGLPFKTSQHYRSSPLIDLRPIAPRGAMRLAPECAMGGRCAGVGPVGVDYWIVELGKRRRTDSIEGGGNLRMTHLSASALLAPGPEGPISTARFEILRQGIQECEARGVLELALADETRREKLGKDLVDRCRRVLKSRADALTFLKAGERRGQRQGWKWFESSGWERRAGELFAAAAEVEEVLRGE